MIKLNLIYIKNNKTKFIQDFENNLIKRMQGKIEIKVTSLSHKKKFSSHEQLMHHEGNLIMKELKETDFFYCFDKEGEKFSSEKFSKLIFSENKAINLIIGGAFGISDDVKIRARRIISFSDMEFSHEIFRLMLLEQIYRAMCIFTNHPYHQN